MGTPVKTVLADTGPLYAAFDPSDQYHQQALSEIQVLNGQKIAIWLASSVILESYSLVLYRFNPVQALAYLKQLERLTQINPEPVDYAQAQRHLQKLSDQKISFFDALLASLSERWQVPVWSYDRHFSMMQIPVWTPDI